MARKTKPVGRVSPIDMKVSESLRHWRVTRGKTQMDVAAALKITFQQVQKYERGVNRIGAGRLYQLSNFLDIPITMFFDPQKASTKKGVAADRESMELMRAFNAIGNAGVRQSALDMIRSLSKSPAAGGTNG